MEKNSQPLPPEKFSRKIALTAADLKKRSEEAQVEFNKDPEVQALARRLQAEGRQYLLVYYDVEDGNVSGDIYVNLPNPNGLSSLLIARSPKDKSISFFLQAIYDAVGAYRQKLIQSIKGRQTIQPGQGTVSQYKKNRFQRRPKNRK